MAIAAGAQEYQHLLDAGFSQTEADQWRAQQTSKLATGGFTQREIDDYWGDTERDAPQLKAAITDNLAASQPEEGKTMAQLEAPSYSDLLAAGWGMSVSGLMLNGKTPSIGPQDSGFGGKLVYSLGEFAGDLPATIIGFYTGATAGAAGGAALLSETGPGAGAGALVGGLAGGGAGSAALPEAMRQVLVDHYKNGDFLTFEDFARRSAHIAWETTKAGLAGAIAGPIAGKVGGRVLGLTGSQSAAKAAELTSYATAATAAHSALSGRVPDADEFAVGVTMALGFGAAGETVGLANRFRLNTIGSAVAQNMQDIYARTGVHPYEQGQRAATDPVFKMDILSTDANGNPIVNNFKNDGPIEPLPYKAPSAETAKPVEVKPLAEGEKAAFTTKQEFLSAKGATPEWLELVRRLEGSGDSAVSPAGAIGRFQIMPDTARQYGFDPARLADPAYNEHVANVVISDLMRRYRMKDGSVDLEAVLIAYNAGPGRAIQFRANGRNFDRLPAETQRYLKHADYILARSGIGDGLGEIPPGGSGGGNEGPPPNAPFGPGGAEGPKKLPPGFELTPEMLASRINDVVAQPEQQSWFSWGRDQIDRAHFATTELAPAMRLDEMLKNDQNAITLTDMFRSTYAASGRAFHMLRFGTLDAITLKKTSNAALLPAWESAKSKGSIAEFDAYRKAVRAVELHEQRGIDIGINLDDARALIAKLGDKYKPELAQARAANDAKIDYLRDSGVISADIAEKVKRDNFNWYPAKRAADSEGPAYGRGMRFGPRQPLKKIKGGDQPWADPVAAEIESFYAVVANADKNRAVASIIAAIEHNKDVAASLGLKQIGTRKVEILDKDGNIIPETFENKGIMTLKDREFAYFDKGVRKVYQVDDPQLAQMIRGATPMERSQLITAAQWFAKLKRSGITDMPDFIARAMMKDAVGSAVLNRYGGAPFVNTLRGIFHVGNKDPIFQEFVASGGLGAALSDMDAAWVARDINKVMVDTGTISGVINSVKHPIEAMQLLMQRADAVSRMGAYRSMKDQGVSDLKAAMLARKYALDFAEKSGSPAVNTLASITPFFRPSILGLKQMYEAFHERPGSTSVKAMAYIALPTAVLYALNYFQDKYGNVKEANKFANLPRWQKDTMFILPSVGGVRIRLPMPPLLGVLVGGMVNRSLDYFVQKDPKAFEEWAATVIEQLIPPVLPAVVAPVYEHVANYNSFQGKPLIPSYLEDANGYMQYFPSTTEVAKKIARVLGPPNLNVVDVSPIVVDNYVRQWLGPMGSQVLHLLDAPLNTGPSQPSDLADVPFIGSFIVRHPDMSLQPIQDFYDARDRIMAQHRDLALSMQQQDRSLIEYNATQITSFVQLTDFSNAINMQRAAILAINTNPDMTPDEKRQYIDDIYSGMVQTAKTGLIIAGQIEKAGN